MPINAALIGSGNIGTDLMIKALRSKLINPVWMVGIDAYSDGLKKARNAGLKVTSDGIEGLLPHLEADNIQIAFDATSAYVHAANAKPLMARGVLELLSATTELRDRLEANTRQFRSGMAAAGFSIPAGEHPIAPVMLGDARLAQEFAERLLAEGIYVIGFSYPVVPQGKARIRVQLSAAHTPEHVDRAIAAFTKVGRALGVLTQA